jgi:hypothetical protein
MILPTKELTSALVNLGISNQDAISSLICNYPINLKDLYGDLRDLQMEIKQRKMNEQMSKVLGIA